jgi:hypothetical protein
MYCRNSHDITYCDNCHACQDCFGCIGLRNKKYCIFNKQYEKESYLAIVENIIEHMKTTGEWGEFFPIRISPFAYNETLAYDYFPLSQEEAAKKGCTWRQTEAKEYAKQTYVIPDAIQDVTDDIKENIIACELCGKNYKIISMELKFLRDQKLPIPRQCPDCRTRRRIKARNPRELHDAKCDSCNAPLKTTQPLGRNELLYCESCYQKAII